MGRTIIRILVEWYVIILFGSVHLVTAA